MADRVPKHPIVASMWVKDPTEQTPYIDAEEWHVEAMPSSMWAHRSDEDKVLLRVRGKPGARHEPDDSVWLELDDDDALRLIGVLAAALTMKTPLPKVTS